MPVAFVTRRLHFAAGHRLVNPALSDEENRDVYGLCNDPGGHGHNYTLEVTVRGQVDPGTGFVMDLNRLGEIVESTVLRDLASPCGRPNATASSIAGSERGALA